MGKQQKSKRSVPSSTAASGGNVGKGLVTPVQVAFIVDRYLSDNGFTESRSMFRKEASSLIGKSPLHEAPEGLLSLDAMLNEYISLKGQKVAMDQERASLDQEKWRIQSLLQGMQQVMNAYNVGASGGPTTPAMQALLTKTTVIDLPTDPKNGSPPGAGCTAYSTPSTVPLVKCSSAIVEPEKASLQSVLHPTSSKRKSLNDATEATSASKRTRTLTSATKLPEKSLGSVAGLSEKSVSLPSVPRNTIDGQIVTGSGVVKRLFNLSAASSPVKSKSSGPITPPQEITSRSGECAFSSAMPSVAGCSNDNTPQELTPTRCTVVSYEKVTVSPYKYTIERSQCIASSSPFKLNPKKLNRRDHIKGRLDFDEPSKLNSEIACVTTTSPSQEDIDVFDWDFPDLGSLGNFSFSELLVDLDLDCVNHSDNPTTDASPETFSGSSNESREINMGPDQFIQASSATITEGISSDKPAAGGSRRQHLI